MEQASDTAGACSDVKAREDDMKKELEPRAGREPGALNAAHASPEGLANAASGSEVGKIEIYKNDLANYLGCASNCDSLLDTVGADLAAASNKLPISGDSVSQLDNLLGEPTTPTQSDDIAAAANNQ
jgi:hypothetical protein